MDEGLEEREGRWIWASCLKRVRAFILQKEKGDT